MLPLSSAILVGTSHQHAEQRVVQSPTLQQPPPTRVTESRDTPQVIDFSEFAGYIKETKNCVHFSICACHPCAGAMLIFSVSFQFYRMILERNPLYKWPQFARKQLSVVLVVCARGVCTSLRLAIPPLTAQRSFACSVASLSQSPRHHLPGHCSFRHIDPAGCHLGQDKPSTC